MPSCSRCGEVKTKFCFIPWEKQDINVDINDIKRIFEPGLDFYSVKRVERELNDPVRTFIRVGLGHNYSAGEFH